MTERGLLVLRDGYRLQRDASIFYKGNERKWGQKGNGERKWGQRTFFLDDVLIRR